MDSVKEWYDCAIINGQMWYICVFGGKQCNEVEDSEEAIVLHVRTQHLRQSVANALLDSICLSASVQSDAEDSEDNWHSIESDEESGAELCQSRPRVSTGGQTREPTKSRQLVFKCWREGCHYQTLRLASLATHVRCAHPDGGRRAIPREFRCTHSGCHYTYATRARLVVHLGHHRCGYNLDGIPGAQSVAGVCRRENISQYVKRVETTAGLKAFRCLFSGCEYLAAKLTTLKDHIHSQHVCPNRPNLRRRDSGTRVAVDMTSDDSSDDE